MKRSIDFIRTIVISIEFIVVLVWSIAFFSHISIPESILSRLILTDQKIQWLALLPTGVMAIIFKESFQLIFPNKDKLDMITNFSDFWILKNMYYATLFYSVVFSLLGIFGWMVDANHNPSLLIVTIISSLIGSSVVYISFHNAVLKINIIFSSKGNDPKS
jgi:hypothetical protein